MILPNPPHGYDANDQAQTRNLLVQEDKRNLKRGDLLILDQFQMRDTADGALKTVVITSGELVIT